MNQKNSALQVGAVMRKMEGAITTNRFLKLIGRLTVVMFALALSAGLSLRITAVPAHADLGSDTSFPAPNADCKWLLTNQSRLMVVRGPAERTGSSAVKVAWYVEAFDAQNGAILTGWYFAGQRTIGPNSWEYVTSPVTITVGAGVSAIGAYIYVVVTDTSDMVLSQGVSAVTQYQTWFQVQSGPAYLTYATWMKSGQTDRC
jgi:hypothetical protein